MEGKGLPDGLVVAERKRQDEEETPSSFAIDSQLKSCSSSKMRTEIDGNKRINGRKRGIAVDRSGFYVDVRYHCFMSAWVC